MSEVASVFFLPAAIGILVMYDEFVFCFINRMMIILIFFRHVYLFVLSIITLAYLCVYLIDAIRCSYFIASPCT